MSLALVVAMQVVCSPFGTCARREPTPSDSAHILQSVRSRQERFERARRDHLPWTDPGWVDHCDETILNYCFTYGDPGEVWKPPQEDSAVTAARDSLLRALGDAADAIPGDGWVAGQRVRYLVEDNRERDAVEAARNCRPGPSWWCAALEGFAYHAAGDFVAAESAFNRSLATMSTGQRCAWTDISELLPDAPASLYRKLDCDARDPVERRFWWLADPLYLTPGNERRSEHFSRHVYAEMETEAPSVSRSTWLKAFTPWIVRYGWPAGWERHRSNSLSVQFEPEIVTHYRGPTQVFEPPWQVLGNLQLLTPEAMPLGPRDARTGYVPAYADRFDTLRYQVARFRVGDSVLIVAAYDLTGDSVRLSTPTLSGLFLTPGEGGTMWAVRQEQEAAGVLALRTPEQSGVLSVEAKTTRHRRAGRARFWLAIPRLVEGKLALSDLLLLSRSDSLPRQLADAIPLARRGVTVRPGEVAGLYWETYGVGPGATPLSVAVTVTREDAGWLRRAAHALRLVGGHRAAVKLAWTDMAPPGAGAFPGTIALDLGKNDPGRYTITIEVSSRDRGTATAQREITIAPDR